MDVIGITQLTRHHYSLLTFSHVKLVHVSVHVKVQLFIIALSEVMNELVTSDISYYDGLICLNQCLVFSTVMTCTYNEDSYCLTLLLSLTLSLSPPPQVQGTVMETVAVTRSNGRCWS